MKMLLIRNILDTYGKMKMKLLFEATVCDRGLFKCGSREITAVRFFKLDPDLSLSQMIVLSPPISVTK